MTVSIETRSMVGAAQQGEIHVATDDHVAVSGALAAIKSRLEQMVIDTKRRARSDPTASVEFELRGPINTRDDEHVVVLRVKRYLR